MEEPASRSRWRSFGSRDALAVVRDAGRGWNDDNALRLGAALSFYAVLALPPILVVALSIAGLLFGQDIAKESLLRQLSELLGTSGSRMFEEMIQTASKPKQGFLAAGLGLLVLLFGATGVFVELRDALNLIWKVPNSGGVLRGLLRGRLLAFNIVVGTGFILIVSLLVSTALAALADSLGSHLDGLDEVTRGLDFGVSCAVIATLFALIFKVLPDVPPLLARRLARRRRDVPSLHRGEVRDRRLPRHDEDCLRLWRGRIRRPPPPLGLLLIPDLLLRSRAHAKLRLSVWLHGGSGRAAADEGLGRVDQTAPASCGCCVRRRRGRRRRPG